MESELITDSPKWEKRLKEIIPSIVSIRSITVRSFDTETQRTSQATGFVVDSELGIILSNRHVVQPGPILADAIFNQSKEEVKLIPIYRDPVHDFGFFKFSVKDLKYMKATHIPLAPEHARVGVDIRVVGNDSGERLSILSGTIARLDRKAPNYGTGHFNDWNTFYYQAASMTSGGSSGSPVVDLEGRAVALNAGGATKAASSFFLPLDRVVRALKLVQENKVITRGTIQTIFQYTPYDELRRLGLPEQIETMLRTKFELNTGMLTVEHVLPSGPSTGKLMPGDILLKIGNCWIPDFVTLEDICDTQVDKKLVLTIQRGTETKEIELVVQDLTKITPDSYIEVGGGVVHQLSYQMARSYMVPFDGVFVASAGYMFGHGGVPRKSIITAMNNQPTPTIEAFIKVMNGLKDGERVPVQFFQLSDIDKQSLGIVQVDRRWHGFSIAKRNDVTGLWDYEKMPDCIGEAIFHPQSATALELEKSVGPSRYIIPSFVYVQTTLPFKIDGVSFQHRIGIGLVIDAERGFIAVDRKTCPMSIGDILVTFSNSVIIPAKMIYLHQVFNFAVLKYDPSLLGTTVVKSAVFSPKKITQGDDVYMVCLTKTYEPLVRKTVVTNIRPFFVGESIPPTYRPTNLEGIEIENPIPQGGVLCNEIGEIQALHSCFVDNAPKKPQEFYMGIDASIILPVLKGLQKDDLQPMYCLEAELTYIQLAQARVLGLSSEWIEKLEKANARRNCVMIRRLTSGTNAFELLKSGDLILTVNNQLCKSFTDITDQYMSKCVNLTLLREGTEMTMNVPLTEMETKGTERIVGWAGAVFQMPYKSVYQQLKSVPEGVLCSVVSHGSPAQFYSLSPLDWVVEINEKPVKDLDSFLECVSSIPSDSFVRVRTMNYSRFSKVITMRTNAHYFGLWELNRDDGEVTGWKLKSF